MMKMINKGLPETDEQSKIRFQVELEFVQCLANPHYLNFLAQRRYFSDPAFVNYLKYLLYWKEPEYTKYVRYPLCLYFLDLLQHEAFRNEIINAHCSKFIDEQMVLFWQHYTAKRSKLIQNAYERHYQMQQAAANASTGTTTAPTATTTTTTTASTSPTIANATVTATASGPQSCATVLPGPSSNPTPSSNNVAMRNGPVGTQAVATSSAQLPSGSQVSQSN